MAFVASGVSVAVSVPASLALQEPNFTGLVLVLTGGLATLLSLQQRRGREVPILAALVLLTAALLVLHGLWHRLGVSHDWHDVLYLGTVVAYCVVAFNLSRRLLQREPGFPPA